jgi:hypothetical protein
MQANEESKCGTYCRDLNESTDKCLRYDETLVFVRGMTHGVSGYVMCKSCLKAKKRYFKKGGL